MESKKKKQVDIGDDMLDRDGMIVEPDVREKVKNYFKAMKLRETIYPLRATYFSNRFQDPGEEYEVVTDDPVGLKLRAKQQKMRNMIKNEFLIRDLIGEILGRKIKESKDTKSPTVDSSDLAIVDLKYYVGSPSRLTIIYSMSGLKSYMDEIQLLLEKGDVEGVKKLLRSVASDPSLARAVISGVHWGRPHKGSGNCNHSAVVRRSVSTIKGYGRKAYIAALSIQGELAPDRNVVKQNASKIWQDFAKGNVDVSVETKPFNVNKPGEIDSAFDDCIEHPGEPFLNASYEIKGKPPGDIIAMQNRGATHFDMLEKNGGKEVFGLASKILGIEFDSIFRAKYGGE